MFLGSVKGHVVATTKDPAMQGRKLLIVEPLKVAYEPETATSAADLSRGRHERFAPTGRAIVVLDSLGAGEGQLVLVTQGSSARMAEGYNKVPVDAVVIGIVDSAVVLGKKIG